MTQSTSETIISKAVAKVASTDDGRLPLDVDLPTSPNAFQGLGVGGTAVFGGFIQENEKDSDLLGRQKYATYSECLANVPIVAAAVRFFLNLVSGAEWKVEAATDEDGEELEGAREIADAVEDMMGDMRRPWHRVIRRLAMFKFYGFAVSEWIAKRRDDGLIGMDDVQPRPQITIERWILDRSNEVLGCVQRSPQTHEDIPIPREKLIYLVDDSLSDSPEGLGLFRHVIEACKRLRRLQQLEGFGYEGDLRGIPVGRAPLAELDQLVRAKKISKQKADELLNGLNAFIQNHIKNPSLGIMLDSTPYKQTGENRTPSSTPMWGLELLDGGTYSLAEVALAITRINREIARIFGVEHLLLGENAAASRSLSEDKSQSFGLIVDSTLLELREQMNKDWLGPLAELNGWDPELLPTLKTETATYRSLAELAEALQALSAAGVTLDRQDEAVQELFDLMGLSRLKKLIDMDPDMQLINPGFGEAGRKDQELQGAAAEAAQEGDDVPEDDGPAPDDDEDEPAPTNKGMLKFMPRPLTEETREQFVVRFMRTAEMIVAFPQADDREKAAHRQFEDRM